MTPTHPTARLLADAAACLRFFSRLPVPALSAVDDPAAPPVFARAAALVPLAGLVIALPAAVVAALAVAAGLPPLVVGAAAVAVQAMVTGALHEDGLADSADGLYGGATPERRLEIMRDSRIGSFGALALATTVLMRAASVGALAAAGPAAVAGALLGAAAASRAAMVAVWCALPPARRDGLAAAGRPSRRAAAVAAALGLASAGCAAPAAQGGGWVLAVTGAVLAAAAVARTARARIGGQTGDVLGAVQQMAEAAFLVGLTV